MTVTAAASPAAARREDHAGLTQGPPDATRQSKGDHDAPMQAKAAAESRVTDNGTE